MDSKSAEPPENTSGGFFVFWSKDSNAMFNEYFPFFIYHYIPLFICNASGRGVIDLREIICSCTYYLEFRRLHLTAPGSQIALKTHPCPGRCLWKAWLRLLLFSPLGCHSKLLNAQAEDNRNAKLGLYRN